MTRLTFLIPLSVFLAGEAMAQSDDAAYCRKLSDYAIRYTGDTSFNGGARPDFDILDGVDKCNKGNTAAGIAVLEKKIRSKGFAPPPR
ncbi:MAG: hypothetical protein FD144_486 [Rhodospirillaceae bacterium]|nr:MAG: hypothetical protein FD144_486 [Rhodospirillaceae bacterium]